MTTGQTGRIEYPKPHATYDQQVEMLVRRGLMCADTDALTALLARTGYYRLSAYVYPFREFLGPDEERTSPRHFRRKEITAGTTFEMVADLWRFDRGLRLTMLDAIETIEVGVKSQIAYVLGRRNRFGHLEPTALDVHAAYRCRGDEQETAHDLWLKEYHREVARAKEDYVVHNVHKYHRLPIWIGLEPQSFGQMLDLFRMMKIEDQDEIAATFEVESGKRLGEWLSALKLLRNEAAHHSRLWNRERPLAIQKPKSSEVEAELHHLRDLDRTTNKKPYATFAVAAYLVRRIDPRSNFFGAFRTRINKFPLHTGFTVQRDMGFPDDWTSLPLWRLG